MGRRALKKLNPELDLSRHLHVLTAEAPPIDPQAFFPSPAPLEIEVGSGKGLFLLRASGDAPQRNFLGCEVSHKYARHAAGRLARAGRTNAVMLDGDALRLFDVQLPSACAAAVHVYFPDPWWKKRHRKRRVLNEQFVRNVQRVLEPGGSLHFWTDVEEYYQVTLELIAELGGFEGPFAVEAAPAEHDLDYRTHFERRTRLHELPVYRSEFRLPARQVVEPAP